MDEHQLAARLIGYDTSSDEGLRSAAAFVKGWLETNDIGVEESQHNGLPVLLAEVGPAEAPSVILHGHLDVVRPGRVSSSRASRATACSGGAPTT